MSDAETVESIDRGFTVRIFHNQIKPFQASMGLEKAAIYTFFQLYIFHTADSVRLLLKSLTMNG